MSEITGIGWTDSTQNFWEGCQKVGPGCDHCYAETRNNRFSGGINWGPGAPRRRTSLHVWNQPAKWNREADAFDAEHGHPRRVFACSLSDIFDNAVPNDWRWEALEAMQATPRLRWQPLTKRIGNVEKMVLPHWQLGHWPRHVGLMITVVTREEVLRDVPKLVDLKRRLGIPWVGLSIEPLLEDVSAELSHVVAGVDWIILGGESGNGARPYELGWVFPIFTVAYDFGIAIFHKQLGANPTSRGYPFKVAHKKGEDVDEWPELLRVRQFPPELLQ